MLRMSKMAIAAMLIGLALPSAAMAQAGAPGTSGWTVEVDPMTDMLDMANRNFASAGQPAFLDAVSFEMSRHNSTNPDFAARQALVDGWVDHAATLLSGQGFVAISDADLQRESGMTLAQLRTMMLSQVPFNQRDVMEAQVGHEIHALLNETPPGCPAGENALIGFVMGYYPTEGARSKFGNVAVMILAVGPCQLGRRFPLRHLRYEATDYHGLR